MIKIEQLDHLVITVASIEESLGFYKRVLGMGVVEFGDNRKALTFGKQKINLHQVGNEFEPKALNATAGSADICLISQVPMAKVIDHLNSERVEVEMGPIKRSGAIGPILSVYFRDPDGNLIEVSNYL